MRLGTHVGKRLTHFWVATLGDWGWRAPAFFLGAAIAGFTVLSPFDALGRDNFVTVHVAQHVALADLAAALLLLGLPPVLRRRLAVALARIETSTGPLGRLATRAFSPVGAFVIWVVAIYAWYVPPLHRLAMTGGSVHVLDHVSFLAAGLLIWLAAFDPRPTRDVRTALRLGGLPWWARHIYAMVTRFAMLLPGFVVWLAGTDDYHVGTGAPPFGISRQGDLERAGAVIIGFEMLLFGLAVVLAFIFVSVHEGRSRSVEGVR